ncbi:glycosyltransferase [Thalassotalea euphylliae]|nr:glycosyltransferase [Thalassotalea euphylliae]
MPFNFNSFPKISVITPSYNQGKYISETIESVVSQAYPNVEYIIIDGGSTDETVSVIKKYEAELAYWVSEPDKGQSHAINKGFSKATGDIFCWLNSDDEFAPNALWHMAVAFMTNDVDMVAGICEVYDDGQLIHRHLTSCQEGELPLEELLDLDNGWNAGQFFYQPEVFFTRELWQRAGGYVREDCYYSMDFELWCRFAINKARLHKVGHPIVQFRSHPEQKTAEIAKFKAELTEVREAFSKEFNLNHLQSSTRPKVNWSNKLKVAFVNDLGFLYGAGIAHMRLAGAFEQAGHNVKRFDLLSSRKKMAEYEDIITSIEEFSPHLVVMGNLHGIEKQSINFLKRLEEKFSCYWLTHDFWLFTGRCAYAGSCEQFTNNCDRHCPTKTEYPVIPEALIAEQFTDKKSFINQAGNLKMLANSKWSKNIATDAVSAFKGNVPVEQIKLGVPAHIFAVEDKTAARVSIGIDQTDFVVALSVSSLSDTRKGGKLFFEALEHLTIDNLAVLLIGRKDESLENIPCKLIELGYVDDVKQLQKAMNAADIYVGPSRQETFGQVFIEAAMCGTPSIGFNHTGVKDAIFDGVTGVLVHEYSPDALAKAIQNLYHDKDKLSYMIKMAPLYARNEYSIEASFASIFNVLDKQGVIDTHKIAHKLSFAKESEIVNLGSKGWFRLSPMQRLNRLMVFLFHKTVGLMPPKFTAKVAQLLPNRIERLIIRWLLGSR